MQAWLDESIRFDGEGVYVVAAVTAAEDAAETARDAMRALLLRGQRRLHWKHEGVTRRLAIAAAIAGLDVSATMAVGEPASRHAQERARRICLETLLPALCARGVRRVWLEARTERLNRKDLEFGAALLSKRLVPQDFRMGVRSPDSEPMLWIADALAGAATAAAHGETGWLKECGDVTSLAVALR